LVLDYNPFSGVNFYLEKAGLEFLQWPGLTIPALASSQMTLVPYPFHISAIKINSYWGVIVPYVEGGFLERAWNFRTVGYGHGLKTWADIISALRLTGYDYVVSIEHEDCLMSIEEGFQKAVSNLQSVLTKDELGDMWWV
jgi:hypothetical protein